MGKKIKRITSSQKKHEEGQDKTKISTRSPEMSSVELRKWEALNKIKKQISDKKKQKEAKAKDLYYQASNPGQDIFSRSQAELAIMQIENESKKDPEFQQTINKLDTDRQLKTQTTKQSYLGKSRSDSEKQRLRQWRMLTTQEDVDDIRKEARARGVYDTDQINAENARNWQLSIEGSDMFKKAQIQSVFDAALAGASFAVKPWSLASMWTNARNAASNASNILSSAGRTVYNFGKNVATSKPLLASAGLWGLQVAPAVAQEISYNWNQEDDNSSDTSENTEEPEGKSVGSTILDVAKKYPVTVTAAATPLVLQGLNGVSKMFVGPNTWYNKFARNTSWYNDAPAEMPANFKKEFNLSDEYTPKLYNKGYGPGWTKAQYQFIDDDGISNTIDIKRSHLSNPSISIFPTTWKGALSRSGAVGLSGLGHSLFYIPEPTETTQQSEPNNQYIPEEEFDISDWEKNNIIQADN